MKKETNGVTEKEVLEVLKRVLPKATHDPKLAGKIYAAVESELKVKSRTKAFEKFCSKVELPDLEAKTLDSVRTQFVSAFGEADITLKPNRKEKALAVELTLAGGAVFQGEVKVNPNAKVDEDGEQEVALKFVPFPVCMPGDKELVWLFAKKENMSPEEAGMALSKAEEEFWASKGGQKLIRDRVERSFPEFVTRVPAGMLSEMGLKRHYKSPEVLKTLRESLPEAKSSRRE